MLAMPYPLNRLDIVDEIVEQVVRFPVRGGYPDDLPPTFDGGDHGGVGFVGLLLEGPLIADDEGGGEHSEGVGVLGHGLDGGVHAGDANDGRLHGAGDGGGA